MNQSIRNSKLTAADVVGIRHRLHHGQSTVKIEADRFMVGLETIRRAARGETYRFIEEGITREVVPEPPAGFKPTLAEAEASKQAYLEKYGLDGKASGNAMLEELEKVNPALADKARSFGVGTKAPRLPDDPKAALGGLVAPPDEGPVGNPLDD